MKAHFFRIYPPLLAFAFISITTSCDKEHDLISDYVVTNEKETSLEQEKASPTLLSIGTESKQSEFTEDDFTPAQTLGE